MFKQASLRFFAGMLFGSSACVFLGVGFNRVAANYLPAQEPVVELDHILRHVIWGAFFGLGFGGLIALGRKPLVSAVASALIGVFSMYLAPAVFTPDPAAFHSRIALGGGLMALTAAVVEIALRVGAKPAEPKTP